MQSFNASFEGSLHHWASKKALARCGLLGLCLFVACRDEPPPRIGDPLAAVSWELYAMELHSRVGRDVECGIAERARGKSHLSEFERNAILHCEAMRYIVDKTAPLLAEVRRSRRLPATAFVFKEVAGDDEDDVGPFPDLGTCKSAEELTRQADVATKRCVQWRPY